MVAANVGITLLPMLAVQPPVAQSENVHLLQFRGDTPSRRIAMIWRKSSAMAPFLKKLAAVLRTLPLGLLDARTVAASGQAAGIHAKQRTGQQRARDLQ
jgi:LysR family hydrogen peroxide-inducible transcriptional activator